MWLTFFDRPFLFFLSVCKLCVKDFKTSYFIFENFLSVSFSDITAFIYIVFAYHLTSDKMRRPIRSIEDVLSYANLGSICVFYWKRYINRSLCNGPYFERRRGRHHGLFRDRTILHAVQMALANVGRYFV